MEALPAAEIFRWNTRIMKMNWKILSGTFLLAGTLFAVAPAPSFAGQISVGIEIGAPPPSRVIRVRPVQPAPEYLWVDGYWYPVNGRYVWHGGYWTRPPYEGARWFGPRHEGGRYYVGYWDGPRGRFEHNHHWDHDDHRDHDRYKDYDHDHDRDHDHDHDHDHH